MVIAFCGRMRSGKTELAMICERYGYERIYFALPLKQLCADILDVSIDGLNEAKNKNTDVSIIFKPMIFLIRFLCNKSVSNPIVKRMTATAS